LFNGHGWIGIPPLERYPGETMMPPWKVAFGPPKKKVQVKGVADFLERGVPAVRPGENEMKRSAEAGLFTTP